MGDNERFRACGASESDERARSAVVLPLCLTGRAAVPICDPAMDDEPYMPFVILHTPVVSVESGYLFVCWFRVSIEEAFRSFLGLRRSYRSNSFHVM